MSTYQENPVLSTRKASKENKNMLIEFHSNFRQSKKISDFLAVFLNDCHTEKYFLMKKSFREKE